MDIRGWLIFALFVAITACNNSVEELSKQDTIKEPVIEAPTLISASSGDNSVTLVWSKVERADEYTVHWQEGDAINEGEIQVQGESFEHLPIKNFVTYHYTVSAIKNNTNSELSNALAATPMAMVTQVSAGNQLYGSDHSCAIRSNGTLWCWGANFSGQLGIGSLEDSAIPIQESTLANDWAKLDAGSIKTCAINLTGGLYCWGVGPVGNGTDLVNNPDPVLVDGAEDWMSVSVGGHSCAIKTNNTLYCWGKNDAGQLGIDTNIYGSPGIDSQRLVPTQEALMATDWSMVSVGSRHTCALRNIQNVEGKTLWCWGNNGSYAIGVTTPSAIQANPIQVGIDKNWKSVSAGDHNNCGLKLDKTVECWGWNAGGVAGQDPALFTSVESPTPIPGNDWVKLSSGHRHSCAEDSSGQLFCWGQNSYGQLGSDPIGDAYIPTQVGSLTDNDWLSFSTGGSQTCGIRQNNQLYCWGFNSSGQIGNRVFAYKTQPTAIANNEKTWLKLSVGPSHTCAIQQELANSTIGSLWCWGMNQEGKLGINNTLDKSVPTPLNQGSNWASVAGGGDSQCAIKEEASANNLYCWGSSWAGQLGIGISGANAFSMLPTQESSLANDWLRIDTGDAHACGIKTDGSLYCWGKNDSGEFGDGTTTRQSIPWKQSDDTSWRQVSAGLSHTCGLKTDNTLWCWGEDNKGQVGDGAGNLGAIVTIPHQEARGELDWSFVDTGLGETCAIKNNGTLWCWGSFKDNAEIPIQVGEGVDWKTISIGTSHYCGIKTDNSLWCWGDNRSGQLGNGSLVSTLFDSLSEEASKSKDWDQVHAGARHTCALKIDGRLFCWGAGDGNVGDGTAWYVKPQQVLFP